MLLVFDLDGTLVDSSRDLADSANALLVSYGAAPLDEPSVVRMVGEGAAVLVARLMAARGVQADPAEALARFLAMYDERLLAHTRPYDGIPEALDELRRWARLAVLTNKPGAATARILDGLGLRPSIRMGHRRGRARRAQAGSRRSSAGWCARLALTHRRR